MSKIPLTFFPDNAIIGTEQNHSTAQRFVLSLNIIAQTYS